MFIHPDAIEHCDGVDENCNDIVDDDPIDGTLFFEDCRRRRLRRAGLLVFACEGGGGGLADNDDDRDDTNEDLEPGRRRDLQRRVRR